MSKDEGPCDDIDDEKTVQCDVRRVWKIGVIPKTLNFESWYLAYCKEVLHRKLALSQMIVQLHYSYLELLQMPPAR